MTQRQKFTDRTRYLVVLLIAIVLTVMYMIFLARTGTNLPYVSRRPGGGTIITWQDRPTAFLFGSISVLGALFVMLLILSFVLDGVRSLLRGKNTHPIYQTNVRSQTPLRVVSGILSLMSPGLGQAFGAHYARSMVWLIGFVATTALSLLLFRFMPSIAGVVLPLVLVVAFRLVGVADASRLELNRPNIPRSRRVIGIIAFGAAWLVASLGFTVGRARLFGESFLLPSGSMEPALLVGDYVLTVPLSSENVVRNQIIMFRWSSSETARFVSRVVGLPGDTIAMRAKKLLRNGKEIDEPFAFYDGAESVIPGAEFSWQKTFLADTANAGNYQPTRDDWGPIIVARNSFFVLGDNRNNSLDSRHRGLVPAALVSLTPQRIYYSRDRETGSFRWNRIGQFVITPISP